MVSFSQVVLSPADLGPQLLEVRLSGLRGQAVRGLWGMRLEGGIELGWV